jgi:hypothetical protein
MRGGPTACTTYARLQLLIFNVHGVLLDCSIFQQKNSNNKIRTTIKTKIRKVIFKLWLMDFLSRCFKNFAVVFWSSKSECYMEKIVPAMLAGTKEEV